MFKKIKTLHLIIIAAVLIITTALCFFVLKPSTPEIKDPMLKKIKTQGKITIGVDATYPPMESVDEKGDFIGMDIDIAKEIASDLGIEAEFKNLNWEWIFDAVKNGEVDMIISAITITSERAKIMAFSDPYFNAGQVVVTKKDKLALIQGAADLKNRKVGVQLETTSETEAKKYTDQVIAFENYDLALSDLLEGKIEALVIDYPAALGMTAKEKELVVIGEPFTQEFYGAAVQIGQTELLGQINTTIKRLKQSGALKKLEEKWLNQ